MRKTYQGFLYAVEYSNRQMKFGVSAGAPKHRIRAHDELMDLLGAVRVRCFVSAKTAFPYRIEADVTQSFAKHAIRGKEWLQADAFDAVVEFIKASLIPLNCQELADVKRREDEGSAQLIEDLGHKREEIPPRAQLAMTFASAVELCAKQHGYEGCLLAPSLEDQKVSMLYEYVARYAYAHRAEDVAQLVCLAANDHGGLERHLKECIEILNVHANVGAAVQEIASRPGRIDLVCPRAA